MTATAGRLEAQMTLSANVSARFQTAGSVTDVTVTVTAGTYYFSTFVDAVEAQLDLALWSIARNVGEKGTGVVVISAIGAATSVKVTWTSALFGEVLGFTGASDGFAATLTAQQHVLGVWLPDVEHWTAHGDETGTPGTGTAAVRVGADRQTISPTGTVRTVAGPAYSEYRGTRWEGVSRGKAKVVGETSGRAGESLEQFWRDAVRGEHQAFAAGPPVKFFWSADGSDYVVVRVVGVREWDPARLVENWVGRYVVALPRLVLEPT